MKAGQAQSGLTYIIDIIETAQEVVFYNLRGGL